MPDFPDCDEWLAGKALFSSGGTPRACSKSDGVDWELQNESQKHANRAMTKPMVARRKPHREFFRIAMDASQAGQAAWSPVTGHEGMIEEQILADNLDTTARTGSRTRLARWQPGAAIAAPVIHDFHEEVFIVAGDLVVGCDAKGRGGEKFDAYTFACRPPQVWHGPFTSVGGCVMLEFQYYD